MIAQENVLQPERDDNIILGEISDFQLPPDVEELARGGMQTYLKRWFTKRLIWAGDWEAFVMSNVFSTAFKRGEAVVTLRGHIRQYLQSTETRQDHQSE